MKNLLERSATDVQRTAGLLAPETLFVHTMSLETELVDRRVLLCLCLVYVSSLRFCPSQIRCLQARIGVEKRISIESGQKLRFLLFSNLNSRNLTEGGHKH